MESTLATVTRERNELRTRVQALQAEIAALERVAIVSESEKVRGIWQPTRFYQHRAGV